MGPLSSLYAYLQSQQDPRFVISDDMPPPEQDPFYHGPRPGMASTQAYDAARGPRPGSPYMGVISQLMQGGR